MLIKGLNYLKDAMLSLKFLYFSIKFDKSKFFKKDKLLRNIV